MQNQMQEQQLEQLLEKAAKNSANDKLIITFQKYFAFKIDSIWTDLFWNFEMIKNKSISSCFMNFFIYVAQMCYFKDNINEKMFFINFSINKFWNYKLVCGPMGWFF